jgi:cytochrome c553
MKSCGRLQLQLWAERVQKTDPKPIWEFSLMMRFIVVLITLALPVAVTAAEQGTTKTGEDQFGDAAKGQPIAKQVCAVCHGADGNSPLSANPNLAGQHPAYLYKQLTEFKSGARANPIMTGMVANLSDEDMRDLAAYYASQPASEGSASNMELVTAGQKLYRAGAPEKGVAACAACHSPDGAGIPPIYPRLSGQHAEYTAAQLDAFRIGQRNNDPNAMMRMLAGRLNDNEIKALAEYISGLR